MPRWGMAVDLDRCNGCGACVTACHAENNISTVGPDQASRGRAKHWIRVERYYEGEFPDVRAKFRPVMCQQCGNAPCEPVCPTYASHHTEDGLNAVLVDPETGEAVAWIPSPKAFGVPTTVVRTQETLPDNAENRRSLALTELYPDAVVRNVTAAELGRAIEAQYPLG